MNDNQNTKDYTAQAAKIQNNQGNKRPTAQFQMKQKGRGRSIGRIFETSKGYSQCLPTTPSKFLKKLR
jgi:hypothetical protein